MCPHVTFHRLHSPLSISLALCFAASSPLPPLFILHSLSLHFLLGRLKLSPILIHVQQLQRKQRHSIRRNNSTASLRPIRDITGADYARFLLMMHLRKCLLPALYDFAHANTEFKRPALIRAVEFLTRLKSALVVDTDTGSVLRFFTGRVLWVQDSQGEVGLGGRRGHTIGNHR